MNETQTIDAPAGTDAASSAADLSNAGSNNSQPANANQVENGSAEDKGNSGFSDGSDGSDGEIGERQRPAKAERRISQLTAKIRALEEETTNQNSVIQQLLSSPTDTSSIRLPSYEGVEEVSPQRLTEDIVKTAEQLIDAKLTGSVTSIQKKIDFQVAAARALQEARQARIDYPVLNENDPENFDADLTNDIDDGFYEIFKVNPNYSYEKHVAKFKKVLEAAGQSSKGTGTTGPRAIRQSANSKQTKEFKDMSTSEMKEWFKTRRAA